MDVDVGFWLAPQASEFKAFRRGPPRTALAWLPLRTAHCLHPFSPLFHATTLAHNARWADVFDVGHFTFHFSHFTFGNNKGRILIKIS